MDDAGGFMSLIGDLALLKAEVRKLKKRAEEAEAQNARLKSVIADLWGECDKIPHAADCDSQGEGYCDCARGDINSMINDLHEEA